MGEYTAWDVFIIALLTAIIFWTSRFGQLFRAVGRLLGGLFRSRRPDGGDQTE
ncbi:MAG: hypothetical protein LBU12_05945 [Deltaproteobacteria bacterium]|jgi:Sec-independent protein translocase protein TatA|nr:hypothetical protein [Deltaproteobacteria bacterium]